MAHDKERLISVFQKVSAGIKKTFILAGVLGTRLSLDTFLIFLIFPRSYLKSFGNSLGNS